MTTNAIVMCAVIWAIFNFFWGLYKKEGVAESITRGGMTGFFCMIFMMILNAIFLYFGWME